MTTRMYLSSDETGVYVPATKKGAWDKTTGSAVERMTTVRCGQSGAASNSENSLTNNFDVLVATFVSDPILANTTISGTLDGRFSVSETNADANDVLHVHLWVTQGDSDTVRGTLLTDFIDTTEFPVSGIGLVGALQLPQQTLSSVSAQAGDRIVAEFGYQAQNTHNTNRSATFQCGGTVADTDGTETVAGVNNGHHPWIEFSTTLAFQSTYLYLDNSAAPVTPAAVRGTWDIDNKLDRYLTRTPPSSAGASRAVTETSTTNPTDGLIYRFVSDELQAQTIAAQLFSVFENKGESVGTADAFGKYHIYVMASDGSVRGTLINNFVQSANELGTTSIRAQPPTTCSSVVCSSGDRIVYESGARFTNVSATSVNVSQTLGTGAVNGLMGAGTLANDTDSSSHMAWLKLDQRLLWLADFTGHASTQCVIAG